MQRKLFGISFLILFSLMMMEGSQASLSLSAVTATAQKPESQPDIDLAIGNALGTCYERSIYSKSLSEENMRSGKLRDLDFVKREIFPYYEKMITALEEYAGYFLFWEAHYYSFSDIKKAKKLLEETAKRYPEAFPGKKAEEILSKTKDEQQIPSLIQQEFKKLTNPVETYRPKKGEPDNSAMNNLKKAIASTKVYKKWKEVFILRKNQDLSSKRETRLALIGIEDLINVLDERISGLWKLMSGWCQTAITKSEEAMNLYKYYLELIVNRYPHTTIAQHIKAWGLLKD